MTSRSRAAASGFCSFDSFPPKPEQGERDKFLAVSVVRGDRSLSPSNRQHCLVASIKKVATSPVLYLPSNNRQRYLLFAAGRAGVNEDNLMLLLGRRD